MNVNIPGGIVAACLAALTAGAASAQRVVPTEALVARCAVETHASGSFALVVQAPVPQVAAALGATARGARRVNDCLEDKYHTQPGVVAGETVVVTGRQIVRAAGYGAARCGYGTTILVGGSGYCLRD